MPEPTVCTGGFEAVAQIRRCMITEKGKGCMEAVVRGKFGGDVPATCRLPPGILYRHPPNSREILEAVDLTSWIMVSSSLRMRKAGPAILTAARTV